jgi:peptide/nickel transport system substrate-binding protein
MSYQNAAMDKQIDAARFEDSKANYEQLVKNFEQKAFEDVPRVPLFQPTQDVAMQKNISGFVYWFHVQPDYRQIVKM